MNPSKPGKDSPCAAYPRCTTASNTDHCLRPSGPRSLPALGGNLSTSRLRVTATFQILSSTAKPRLRLKSSQPSAGKNCSHIKKRLGLDYKTFGITTSSSWAPALSNSVPWLANRPLVYWERQTTLLLAFGVRAPNAEDGQLHTIISLITVAHAAITTDRSGLSQSQSARSWPGIGSEPAMKSNGVARQRRHDQLHDRSGRPSRPLD